MMAQQNRNQSVKVAKMVEFIKTCEQYPRKFNFGQFSAPQPSPLSAWEKQIFSKRCSVEMDNFLLPEVVMTKTRGRVLLGGMSKNKQIQVFHLQMYFPVILTP